MAEAEDAEVGQGEVEIQQRDVEILGKLEETFTEPAFMIEIEDFLDNHVDKFAEDEEQSIEGFEIYSQYKTRIEGMVTQFCEEAQITEESLFEVIKGIWETSPDSLTCLDYVMSATDYTEFLDSMLNRKRLKNWEGDK